MIERDEIEQVIAALERTTAMCRSAATWTPDDVQGLRYHALEAAKDGMAALEHRALLRRSRAVLPEPPSVEQAFKAGWRSGYYDGGEHDCRMFPPTAERAWDDYQHEHKAALSPDTDTAPSQETTKDKER